MKLSRKLYDVTTSFTEVPNRVSLCFWFSGCTSGCDGCHTPWLVEDVGKRTTTEEILETIARYDGMINAVCCLGGYISVIIGCVDIVHQQTDHTICWYTENQLKTVAVARGGILLFQLDYVKVGTYNKDLGGLGSKTTNQRFYALNGPSTGEIEDLTHLFQK